VRGLNKKCPSGRRAADRADPWRARPPVGCCEHNPDSMHRRRKSRFRQRVCPRKGCEAVYTPRTGNHRYCQDQQCLQEVRRWQAARRQKQRRLRPDVRKTQAAAAKVAGLRKSLLKLDPPSSVMHHGEATAFRAAASVRKVRPPTSSRVHAITLLRQPWQRPCVPSGICRRPCSNTKQPPLLFPSRLRVRSTACKPPSPPRQFAGSQLQRADLGLESPRYLHSRSIVVHSASGGVSTLVTALTSVLWLQP
jgi:hypothetical protein